MRLARHMTIVALALVIFGALTAIASANRLSYSTNTFSATWGSIEFSGGFGTASCHLTLAGSIHSNTITKAAGQLIAYINRASVATCATGSATVLTATLPWHVTFAGFTGTLPTITGIKENNENVAFQITEPVFGVTCLATSTSASPSTGTFNLTRGAVSSLTLGGSIPCSGTRGTISGTSTTASPLTITLI